MHTKGRMSQAVEAVTTSPHQDSTASNRVYNLGGPGQCATEDH